MGTITNTVTNTVTTMVFRTVLALGLLLAVINRTLSLSCLPCHEVDCGAPPICSYGTTGSVCGCCDVCAKGPGEICGGPWDTSGTCVEGLECQLKYNDFNAEGTCVYSADNDIIFPETYQRLRRIQQQRQQRQLQQQQQQQQQQPQQQQQQQQQPQQQQQQKRQQQQQQQQQQQPQQQQQQQQPQQQQQQKRQ